MSNVITNGLTEFAKLGMALYNQLPEMNAPGTAMLLEMSNIEGAPDRVTDFKLATQQFLHRWYIR